MKEIKHKDSFKDRLKNKMDDSPVYKDQEEELWSKVIGEIDESEKKVRRLNPIIWYASAASLLIGLLAGIFYWDAGLENTVVVIDKKISNPSSDILSGKNTDGNQGETGYELNEEGKQPKGNKSIPSKQTFSSAIAASEAIKEYNLPDGSHLTLNKEASVKISEDFKKGRSLSMQGEVYFEIEPDKARPFTIYFDKHRLLVVGTKFNVRSISDEHFKEISVTEGIVIIFPNNTGKGIKVKAGEQLKLSTNEKPATSKIDPYNFIFWKTGILDFKNSTMEEVAMLMSRKFKQPVNLNPSIEKCTFTGDLTQLSLDEAMKIIEITTSYKVEKRKHDIYITGEGCK